MQTSTVQPLQRMTHDLTDNQRKQLSTDVYNREQPCQPKKRAAVDDASPKFHQIFSVPYTHHVTNMTEIYDQHILQPH